MVKDTSTDTWYIARIGPEDHDLKSHIFHGSESEMREHVKMYKSGCHVFKFFEKMNADE